MIAWEGCYGAGVTVQVLRCRWYGAGVTVQVLHGVLKDPKEGLKGIIWLQAETVVLFPNHHVCFGRSKKIPTA